MTEIQQRLFTLQDLHYRDFHSALMPTVDPDTVIGVRIPALRQLARELRGTKEASAFLEELPHRYYEENNLHGFLIADIHDFDACLGEAERFLPCVDNWATCDSLRPRCFAQHKAELLPCIRRWLESRRPYTIRFAMEMLMVHYLDGDFSLDYPQWVAGVASDEYYVNMMAAWYFATALAKQYDAVVGYLDENRLPEWVHNKTIQKAVESCRITQSQKAYLRTLKR